MAVMQRVRKAATRKGKKILLRREPKLIEDPKRCVFLYGRKTSEVVRKLAKDFHHIKKPHSVVLTKKNDVTVFENPTVVEHFCRKHEASLFVMCSHSKKRPDNLVLGRLFNYTLLDMFEFHVSNFEGLTSFSNVKLSVGTKPCLIFNGSQWQELAHLQQIKSLLIDMFHKGNTECVRMQGIEHALSFTLTSDNRILLRSYKIMMKRSECSIPRIELEEIGPRVDLTLRRSKLSSEDLMQETQRKPKELRIKKRKNINMDKLGTTTGRIHIGKQNIDKIKIRKVKALKQSARKQIHMKKCNGAENYNESVGSTT